MEKLDKSIIERFKKLDTTCVSDAMDRCGVFGAFEGIKAVVPGTSLCGQAFTTHNIPCTEKKETAGDYLDQVEEGQVVVIDNAGRTNMTVWGDLMSWVAMNNGVAGTIIDGVCRDIPAIREMKYPIFTKGVNMVTGKQRVFMDAYNVPVSIGGVTVKPGDLIMADDSGALCIPFDYVMDVLQAAEEIDQKEKLIIGYVKEGKSLKEARQLTGYHTLQSRKE